MIVVCIDALSSALLLSHSYRCFVFHTNALLSVHPSIRPSVYPSVRPFPRLSVRPPVICVNALSFARCFVIHSVAFSATRCFVPCAVHTDALSFTSMLYHPSDRPSASPSFRPSALRRRPCFTIHPDALSPAPMLCHPIK